MRFLILGSDNLAEPLKSLGCHVLTCGPAADADLPMAALDPDWREISDLLHKQGFVPDAVLVNDEIGRRKLPTGIWAAPAVTVFYGLDAPLNAFWQTPYSRLFDLVFLDQPKQAGELSKKHGRTHWLPVGIQPELYWGEPAQTEKPGVCFVGVVDERVRPKRSALLNKISKIAPLEIRGGRKGQWFPTSRAAKMYRSYQVVLNENLFQGVTTRPLEVMAAGGCLLSEAAPGAMDRFFSDGEGVTFFDPYSLEHKLESLLNDASQRRRQAAKGRDIVMSGHTLAVRAKKIISLIEDMSHISIDKRPRARGGDALSLEGEALLMAGLRWPHDNGPGRVLRGRPRLEAAAADGAEPLAASRAAGLAACAIGDYNQAARYFSRSAELGGEADRLALSLVQQGASGASLHIKAAAILIKNGAALSVGFNRGGLHPVFWTALEHLREAAFLSPGDSRPWEMLGDILLAGGAPNQALEAYEKASALGCSQPGLAEKRHRAAREGYLI